MDNQMPRQSSPGKSIKKLFRKIEKAEDKLKATVSSEGRKRAYKELDDLKAQLAWQYLEAKEFEKAAGIYDKLPKNTHNRDHYCGKARILIETQKYDEARKLLEEALLKFPDYVPLLNTLGILYNVTADYYEALRYFDQALTIDPPNNPWSLSNKVFALRSLGYYEEEHKLLVKLLESDHDNPDFNAELAYCEGQRGNYPETVKGCKKLLENGYETPLLYTWLCQAYSNMDCAYESFATALEGVNKFPEQEALLYSFLGLGYMKLEQFEEAKTAFQQGLALDPESELFPNLIETVKNMLKRRNTKKRKIKGPSDNLGQGGLL
jgi:tetratricopeptide (TPR) repeat protein